MKCIILFTGIMAVCLWGPAVDADIYVWTDEGGIRHFSNRDSHPEAELFLKTMEGPYEEAVERAQEENEKQRENWSGGRRPPNKRPKRRSNGRKRLRRRLPGGCAMIAGMPPAPLITRDTIVIVPTATGDIDSA